MALTDEVKQALNIVDVVSEYVALDKLHSRTPEANCPFHEERTPSFKLNLESDTWRCFGACSIGGDIFNFVQRIEGISFPEALDKLCDQAGIERRRRDDDETERRPTKSEREAVHDVNGLAADYWHKQLAGEAGNEARDYLQSRGIDLATAQKWGIGFAPSGATSLLHYLAANQVSKTATAKSGLLTKSHDGRWRDMFFNRIMFALRDRDGNIIGFAGRAMSDNDAKYINTAETQYFQKSELVYGLHRATDAIGTTGISVVVEGYMDVITAHEYGFRNVVACMGTAVTRQQLASIATALPFDGQPMRRIVMCLDNDDAGVNATLNSLGAAVAQFAVQSQANSNAKPVEIKVARPVASGDGAPKDPDEAIRQDAQAWWRTIESPADAHEFAFESALVHGSVDEAIAAALPFIGKVPPSTIAARRRIEQMADRVGMPYENLLGVLVQLRRDQIAVESERRPARQNSHNRRPRKSVPQVIARNHRYDPSEFELAACLVQSKDAIDHVPNLEPMHFESKELGDLFDLRRRCASIEEVGHAAALDSSLAELHLELMQHQVTTETSKGISDTGELKEVVNACAKRVRQNHLRRCKKHEVEMFKEQEVLADDERMSEMLQQAIDHNRQLGELAAS